MTIKFKLIRKKKNIRTIIILITSLAGILFAFKLLTESYLIRGLIPVGWDTGVHMYYAKLILDGQFDIMLVKTNGNNFLPFILIALLSFFTNDIMFSRIVISVSLPMILFVVLFWTSKKLLSNLKDAILTVIICILWLTTYRLSSDLHRTMIAFICIIPIFYLHTIENPTLKNRILIAILIVLASFSQIEVTILFGGTVLSLEFWRLIRVRKIKKANLINLIVIISSIIPAFIIAIYYSTYFIDVAIDYSVPLDPPSIDHIFQYLGGPLVPFTLIGISFLVYDLLSGKFDRYCLITMYNVVILFFIILPSYLIADPSLFRRMSSRATNIILVPILIVIAIKRLYKIIQEKLKSNLSTIEKKKYQLKLSKSLVILSFIILILSTSLYIPKWTRVHQRPFITERALDQLKAISDSRDPKKILICVMNEEYSFKDSGWAGVFFGNYYYYNGPFIFLISGLIFPFEDPRRVSEIKTQLENIQNQGINFPINSSNIELALISEFYGQLSPEELKIANEVGPEAYLIDGTNASKLLEEFSYYGTNYYKIKGEWKFSDNRAIIRSENIFGEEYITYLIPLYYQGNYSINITYLDGAIDAGGFKFFINDTVIDQILYCGVSDSRNYTVKMFFDAKTLIFLRIEPLNAFQDDIEIAEISVKYEDET